MSERAGIGAQLGVKKETTFGTYAAPTKGLPFESESLARTNQYVKSKGLRQGRLAITDNDHSATTNASAGDVNGEVYGSGEGILLDMLHGDVITPAVIVAATVWKQTHQVGLTSPNGKSRTVQVGRPDVGGTVRPFSYLGAKLAQYELTMERGGVLTRKASFDAAKEDTGQTLATLTYDGAASTMKFQNATLEFDDTVVTDVAHKATVSVSIPLASDRYGIGIGATKAEQFLNDQITATIALEMEFASLALHTAFINATRRKIALKCEGDALDGTHNQELWVTAAKCVPVSSGPVVSGPDIITQAVTFDCVLTGSSPLLQFDYQTSESAI